MRPCAPAGATTPASVNPATITVTTLRDIVREDFGDGAGAAEADAALVT